MPAAVAAKKKARNAAMFARALADPVPAPASATVTTAPVSLSTCLKSPAPAPLHCLPPPRPSTTSLAVGASQAVVMECGCVGYSELAQDMPNLVCRDQDALLEGDEVIFYDY